MNTGDITTLKPMILRRLLASYASASDSACDSRQKALLLWRLRQHDWLPTWEMSPVPLATVQQWLNGLSGARTTYMAGVLDESEDTIC